MDDVFVYRIIFMFFFLFSNIAFNVSGGGISHSLSWHKKGDRIPGCKLYARVWTPEDPRANQRGLAGPSYPVGSHTGLDI